VQRAEPLRQWTLVAAEQIASSRIERYDLTVRCRDEHDSVVYAIGGDSLPESTPVEKLQTGTRLFTLAGVDLIERAVAPALVVAAGHQPISRFRIGETRELFEPVR
jgi:hypothetical protein